MRKNYFYRAVLFFVCMLLPAVSGSAKAPLGTPTREALLQLAWDCLEEYNFCDIHMNLAAGRGKSTETTAAEMDDLPMDSADVVTDDSGEAFVPQQYIMVGDSRFVGMQQAVGDAGCVWIGQVSAGLDWFANTAVPEIDAVVGDGSVIIINMGVNDLGNVWSYLDILNQKVRWCTICQLIRWKAIRIFPMMILQTSTIFFITICRRRWAGSRRILIFWNMDMVHRMEYILIQELTRRSSITQWKCWLDLQRRNKTGKQMEEL